MAWEEGHNGMGGGYHGMGGGSQWHGRRVQWHGDEEVHGVVTL